MRFTRNEIATAVGGALTGSDGIVEGVSIDSRTLLDGMLFVPIVAERDGHQFLAAIAERASAWLTMHPSGADGEIAVADTANALRQLGSYARTRLPGKVIGVTGSSGKTSTKDLLAAVLAAHGPSAASEKSFNNELGVPLTLVNAPDDAFAAVIEMGARGVGHIATLCGIARPTVGVVTNIGTAHRELFKSAHSTAVAKGELLQSLPSDGTAVLNRDDAMFDLLSGLTGVRVLAFSTEARGAADLRADAIVVDDDLRARFRMHTPWGDAEVRLGARGRHQVANALAAAGAALSIGCSLDEVAQGLATTVLSGMHMELVTLRSGARILNDAYNANPGSMAAALDALGAIPAKRRIAVLGTMAELGEDADALHRAVGERVRASGIDAAFAVDAPSYGLDLVGGVEGAVAALRSFGAPRDGDVILVKGSRVAGLERLVAALQDPAEGRR